MKVYSYYLKAIIVLAITILYGQSVAQANPAVPTSAAIPLMFIEAQPDHYQVQMKDRTMWFANDSLWLSYASSTSEENGVNLKLTFENANPQVRLEPANRLETHISKFIGNDPGKWQVGIPVYGGVRYRNLYPGQDLVITSEQGKLAWDLTPAYEKREIRVSVDDGRSITHHVLDSEQDLSSQLAAIIDPSSPGMGSHPFIPMQGTADLQWSTFVGSNLTESGYALIVDSGGNMYVSGFTTSTGFPTTTGAFDTSHNGSADAFVVKLNSTGTALIYATFVGGGNNDYAGIRALAVDSGGNVYISGRTSSTDFPTTAGAYDTSHNGGNDAFIAKLNNTGTALTYATYVGGMYDETARGLAVDSGGNVYVGGSTYSDDFPATAGAYDTSRNGGEDVFVVKLDSAGANLSYATFLGGTDHEATRGLVVDSEGNVYVSGETHSTDFPTTAGAFDTSHNGTGDVFVARLNSTGAGLIYSTFLGGFDSDWCNNLVVDSEGNVYAAGGTSATDFPTTAGAYDTSHNGWDDAFVAKLNSTGTALIYASYLGGSSDDLGVALAVDSGGNVYVGGYTYSDDFPATAGAYDTSRNGGEDVFVVKLDSAGANLSYATFLGGTDDDLAHGMVVDSEGNVYVSGETYSTDFPTTAGAFDTSHNGLGARDVFVSKLKLGAGDIQNQTYLPVVIK